MVTARSFSGDKRIRMHFGSIQEVAKVPNLIEVQKSSYDHFLMMDTPEMERGDAGLNSVFQSVFPVKDFSGRSVLEFVSYTLDIPKFDVYECRIRSLTYSAPLRVKLRLIVFDIDEDTGKRSVRDIKEQDVYMGDIPLMTENGTFVVNGTERVVVSQMHRSPGIFFDHDRGKTHISGKFLFSARVIPYRGSWLDFEYDSKDIIYTRIDRKRKFHSTTLLYALGYTSEQILDLFYNKYTVSFISNKMKWRMPFNKDHLKGAKLSFDLIDEKTEKVILESGKKITPRHLKKMEEDGVQSFLFAQEHIIGCYVAEDLINTQTGEIYVEAGDEITSENLELLVDNGYTDIPLLDIDHYNKGAYIRNTLLSDKNDDRIGALFDIYRIMRPGEPPTVEAAEALLNTLFFDIERYDLSSVGRVKMNMRLNLQCPDDMRVLRNEDILEIMRFLHDLRDGRGDIDDIDHLGNRRIRSVGELMENQYRIGLVRMERSIRERMSGVDVDTIVPQDLINAKPVSMIVREFFGASQLSQFMDQTNPLSEVTHKRRLSALGPGGLSRDRAGFEVRDVHPTHYGRICPIETPEGPNIGLINSLATYARVNKYGFIESPYRRVVDSQVTEEVVYLSAMEEMRYTIAQANSPLSPEGAFLDDLIQCRCNGDQFLERAESIQFMDVTPKQVVSVAASLIPFLENDDANRALMGSNMQRQAVPLLRSEAPMVGTGMEAIVAHDSGALIAASREGIVEHVDATRIVVRAKDQLDTTRPGVDIYRLQKFQRSNQNTCINQKPLVKIGDYVQAGGILADGPSTDQGELALGRNVLVAFMPWNGYNFEDSILLSENIVKEDVFTSIHIEEFEISSRDTKLGPEEITRDIPNLSEESLRNLDEAGIVYIGSEVNPGDILVGKITPKGETMMTPEEKLLRAIFGEKASDVRDTSLRVPPGVSGTVVEVRVFNRHGVEKDERARQIEREEIERLARDRDDELHILERNIGDRIRHLLLNQTIVKAPRGLRFAGDTIILEDLEGVSSTQLMQIDVSSDFVMSEIQSLRQQFDASKSNLMKRFDDRLSKITHGDELPPGVMKMIRIFVAVKRKIQPGDKMAGRHGNKGVVSKIVPVEDMPYTADGTPVDIVLNPLGVPSRMNVGQILETHLGWVSAGLGKVIKQAIEKYQISPDLDILRNALRFVYGDAIYASKIENASLDSLLEMSKNVRKGVPFATPVFDGIKQDEITELLNKVGHSAQTMLYDGKTGEMFDRPVTVGYIYMLKLHHLVDDKIHARSVGPYSLVTQQPLGGKAQFGGQRFGEMEVWALQAYGAAHTLQEMLTIKSDDVSGRTKVYEAIIKGDNNFESGIPESFNVLVKEMRSLCLNVELLDSQEKQ
jgi:DNA-directed RNA polymerase subunit beta